MDSAVTFLMGLPYAENRLFLTASPDSDAPYTPYSVWYVYIADDALEPWTHFVTRWWAVASTVFRQPNSEDWALVGMSNEGHLDFTWDETQTQEKIPGAGVFSEGAKGWGYMRSLRQIGNHLYAVGGAGQVYKRLGPDQWIHMDDGVLQPTDVEDRLLLADIHGASEDDIYICGGIPGTYGLEGRLYHWDGQQWASVPLPTTERLTALYLEDADTVWICGANGTLLRGNWRNGFVDVSTIDDNQLFTSLTRFNGRIYLASNLGLFEFDGKAITKVRTGLTPELQDANVVDAVDGVLWSIGTKDIAKCDGTTWTRIDHPDNPPIR